MTPPLVAAIESMCRRPDLVVSVSLARLVLLTVDYQHCSAGRTQVRCRPQGDSKIYDGRYDLILQEPKCGLLQNLVSVYCAPYAVSISTVSTAVRCPSSYLQTLIVLPAVTSWTDQRPSHLGGVQRRACPWSQTRLPRHLAVVHARGGRPTPSPLSGALSRDPLARRPVLPPGTGVPEAAGTHPRYARGCAPTLPWRRWRML